MKKAALLLSVVLLVILFADSCKKDKPNPPLNNPNDTTHIDTTHIPLDTLYIQSTPWPKWVFQHWVWEGEGTTASARQLVDDYLAHNIPVGAIIIDSPWETDYNTFEWDGARYPNAQGMIDYFHQKNVRVLCWITGIIDTTAHPQYDYARDNNFFMRASSAATTPAVISWWKGKGSLIDWYNPAAVAWWKTQMDKALDMGIDGWKCDGTDFSVSLSPYSPEKGANVDRLDYSQQYYQLFQDYSRQKLGNDQVVMCRPIDNYAIANFGGDAVAFCHPNMGWACWVGDQDASFGSKGILGALNNMYWSSVYTNPRPYLSFGSDIGGYRTDDTYGAVGRSKQLFIRWAQLGTFCGLMENGGGGEHRPWMFDQQTNDIYKKLVDMREKYLVGYLLKESVKADAAGKSLMRFQNSTGYSYLLGDDIFVAPVLDEYGNVTISFPSGSDKWVYLYDNSKVYDGGTAQTLFFPIDQCPVFVKQGTSTAAILKPY